MVRDDAQVREFLEEGREHHARHGDARLERPAEHLPDLVFRFLLADVVGARAGPRRVHPHRHAVLLRRALEHREELRLVERAAVHAGADLHAARAELCDGAVHLLERRGNVVHGERGDERGEFLRPLRRHARHAVVGDARKLGRELGSSHQLGGGQRQRQHLLHVGEFFIQHPHPRLDVPEQAQVAHALQDALVLQVLLHHFQVGHRHDVIENVDFHDCESVWSPERRTQQAGRRLHAIGPQRRL